MAGLARTVRMTSRPFNSAGLATACEPAPARQSYKRHPPQTHKPSCSSCPSWLPPPIPPTPQHPRLQPRPSPAPNASPLSCPIPAEYDFPSTPDSVHCLCNPCNPIPNARSHARPASPPAPVAHPAARAARCALRSHPHVAVCPGATEWIEQTSVEPPSPRPPPPHFARQLVPSPRHPVPVAPPGRPTLPLACSLNAVIPRVGSSQISRKIRPNCLSPARPQRGRAGERQFPPSPPRSVTGRRFVRPRAAGRSPLSAVR